MKGQTWYGGSPFLKSRLGRPGYGIDQDLFIAEWNRRLAGCADTTPELRISRVVLDWFLHPGFQRKRIGRALVRSCMDRARQLGAELMHVCAQEEDPFSRDFLKELGFEEVRCFLDFETGLVPPRGMGEAKASIPVTHFRAGDEPLLATVQNRVFSGSWGFCPNSPDDIRYYIRLTESKWQDILTIKQEERVAGYLWCHRTMSASASRIRQRWRIHMFGIDPDFQGKGWGRRLLVAGLDHIRKRGGSVVELTVDQENTPARSLYASLGFVQRARHFWYEKRLV